jgi:hypothetical protein
MKKPALTGIIACLVLLGTHGVVAAQSWTDMLRFSGYVDSEIRFIVDDDRGEVSGQGYEFQLNRNDVNFRLGIMPSDNVQAIIDTRFRYYGFNQAKELPQLIDRAKVDPYAIYLDEAYLQTRGLLWEGMDLRIGRLVQNWGAADQFNPTDNLNSRDFSDPLDPSRKVPNQMVELSLYPADWLEMTFVWVPVFKPAQLPPSAQLGFAVEYDRQGCFKSAPIPPLRNAQMVELVDYFGSLDECKMAFIDPSVRLHEPEPHISNSQAAARAKILLGPLDVSLSYYYGRFGFPIPYTAIAHATPRPEDSSATDIRYKAEVIYPRMHVAGLDFTYSADWLFGVGFMGEMAVIFPEEVIFGLRAFRGTKLEIDMANQVIAPKPFIKGTLGMDYTFTGWLYANVMWVHGFIDEFNDTYGLHDYLVGATDLKFFDTELAIRLAGVWDITQKETGSFAPEITWIVFPGAELKLAGMFFFGATKTPSRNDVALYQDKWKFGQKAAGRNVVSFKAKVNW